MINVAISTPTKGDVKATYCSSLLDMVLYYLSNPIPGREQEERLVAYASLIGSTIHQSRDYLVDGAFQPSVNATHVLFIDDDNGFGAPCLTMALARNKPIVLANYRMTKPPWRFTAKDMNKQEVVTDELSTGLQSIMFGGFGFCLIERQVFDAIEKPRFLNIYEPEVGTTTTEDYAFFQRAREAGFEVFLDHDISKQVWHVGDFAFDYTTFPVTKDGKRLITRFSHEPAVG
jgi:hypothetical protein